jgi:hypothetical protein
MSNKEKTFVHAFALLQSTHPESEAQLQQLLATGIGKSQIDGMSISDLASKPLPSPFFLFCCLIMSHYHSNLLFTPTINLIA